MSTRRASALVGLLLSLTSLEGCRRVASWRCHDEPKTSCFACCKKEGYPISGHSKATGCECFGEGDVVLQNP